MDNQQIPNEDIFSFKIHINTMNKLGMGEIIRMFSMVYALQQGFTNWNEYYELTMKKVPGADEQLYFAIEYNDKRRLEEQLWKQARRRWWWFW